jgi:hypothetical protein
VWFLDVQKFKKKEAGTLVYLNQIYKNVEILLSRAPGAGWASYDTLKKKNVEF